MIDDVRLEVEDGDVVIVLHRTPNGFEARDWPLGLDVFGDTPVDALTSWAMAARGMVRAVKTIPIR